MPRGQRGAADANGNAIMITKISTSQGIVTEYGENAAVELGRMGGKAWAAAMTAKKH